MSYFMVLRKIVIGLSLFIGIVLSVLIIPFCSVLLHGDTMKSRIWLHRTNSVEKMKEFAGEYDNFECDVIFRNPGYDVTHDENVSYGIVLDSIFHQLQLQGGMLWIDLKNLSDENKSDALAELQRLTRQYDINPSRLIIESRNWHALHLFTEKGFYTSYYVDRDSGKSNPEQFTHQLQEVAESGCVKALSFFGEDYYFIKSRIDTDLDLLTWEHHTAREALALRPRGTLMLHDPQVKVILVKDKGAHHK